MNTDTPKSYEFSVAEYKFELIPYKGIPCVPVHLILTALKLRPNDDNKNKDSVLKVVKNLIVGKEIIHQSDSVGLKDTYDYGMETSLITIFGFQRILPHFGREGMYALNRLINMITKGSYKTIKYADISDITKDHCEGLRDEIRKNEYKLYNEDPDVTAEGIINDVNVLIKYHLLLEHEKIEEGVQPESERIRDLSEIIDRNQIKISDLYIDIQYLKERVKELELLVSASSIE